MWIIDSLLAKWCGVDPGYIDVSKKQIPKYQKYIDMVLSAVDINTQTAWSMSKSYDKDQFRHDEDVMEEIIVGKASKEGFSPRVLQVMVNQYFFADVYQREMDRNRWALRVVHRKPTDYFPSALAMNELLSKITG